MRPCVAELEMEMSVSAITLLGVPGAGKGTIAAGIKEKSSFVHVSTGDLLREAVKAKTAVGVQAEAYMKRGDLVPDNVILDIVMERIVRDTGERKYMFDGFPRTLAQAEMLKAQFDARGAVLSRVFLLEISTEVSLERLSGRRICRKCGANFHVVNIPPRKEGVCDACGGELYQRADDKESTILNRLKIFHDQSAGLFSYYEKQGVLVRVDSSRNWRTVVDEILSTIESVAKRPSLAPGDKSG